MDLEHLERCLRLFDTSLTTKDPSLDDSYMETMHLIRSGKNATHIDKASKAYAYICIIDQLCIETYREQDVLRLEGCRLVVPTHRHDAILRLLHAGHGGIAKTYRTTAQLYFWPNMKANIEQSVANCSPCQEQRQSNPKPLIGEVRLPGDAKQLMLHTACDLFSAVKSSG